MGGTGRGPPLNQQGVWGSPPRFFGCSCGSLQYPGDVLVMISMDEVCFMMSVCLYEEDKEGTGQTLGSLLVG